MSSVTRCWNKRLSKIFKSYPKCSHSSLAFFKLAQKVTKHLGHYCKKVCVAKNVQNRPIWSHWTWGGIKTCWMAMPTKLSEIEARVGTRWKISNLECSNFGLTKYFDFQVDLRRYLGPSYAKLIEIGLCSRQGGLYDGRTSEILTWSDREKEKKLSKTALLNFGLFFIFQWIFLCVESGTVGRAVTSNPIGPWFESSHW